MSYIRAFISTCDSLGWTGGPGFSTDVQVLRSGRESRNGDWAQVQHFYSVPFMNILHEQYLPIKQMHMVCMGRLHNFLYRDLSDYVAVNEALPVAVNGQDSFQLVKTSTIAGVTYRRNVYSLYTPDEDGDAVATAIIVTVDGMPTASFTADPDRGTIVFDSPMTGGEIVRWSGEFSQWVRFDNDRLPFTIDNKSSGQFVMNGMVDLLEQFPPLPEVESGG